MTPIIVQGTLAIATAITEAAALGFLGMGAQVPTPEIFLLFHTENFRANQPSKVCDINDCNGNQAFYKDGPKIATTAIASKILGKANI